jgi:hypothetical protein
MIAKSRRARWHEIIPFFKFSPDVRKAVYTVNAIEPVNYTIQKNHQTPPVVSERRGGREIDLYGLEQHFKKAGHAHTGLGGGPQPVRHFVRKRAGSALVAKCYLHKTSDRPFKYSLVIYKCQAVARNFSQLVVETFDGVGRINRPADLRRVFEKFA